MEKKICHLRELIRATSESEFPDWVMTPREREARDELKRRQKARKEPRA